MSYHWDTDFIPELGIVNDLYLQDNKVARLIFLKNNNLDGDDLFSFNFIWKNEIREIKASSCINAKKIIENNLLPTLAKA